MKNFSELFMLRRHIGVLLALAAQTAYAWSNVILKCLPEDFPPYEVAMLASLVAIVALPWMKPKSMPWRKAMAVHSKPRWFLLWASAGLTNILVVVAFMKLPMATALALIFLNPLFVFLLAVVFLRETPTRVIIGAVLIGLTGTWMVLQPTTRGFGWGEAAALGDALTSALVLVLNRSSSRDDEAPSIYMAYVAGMGMFSAVGCLFFGWTTPSWSTLALVASYGLMVALGTWLVVSATRHAAANVLSTTKYSQMLWAIVVGVWLFNDHVTPVAWIGVALIMFSGWITVSSRESTDKVVPILTQAQK